MNAPLPKPDQYVQVTGSPHLQAVEKFGRSALDATSWPLPIELVLALPTSSTIAAWAETRMLRGERPLPLAQTFWRHGRLFTTVEFAGGGPGLFFALDVWARSKP